MTIIPSIIVSWNISLKWSLAFLLFMNYLWCNIIKQNLNFILIYFFLLFCLVFLFYNYFVHVIKINSINIYHIQKRGLSSPRAKTNPPMEPLPIVFLLEKLQKKSNFWLPKLWCHDFDSSGITLKKVVEINTNLYVFW